MSSEYFGLSPDGFQKPIYAANNFSDVVDKPTALVNLGAASADDVLKAANPIGTIIAFYGSVAPYGYLPCSGQTVSSSTFPSLVSFLGGTTSATIPDLRGEFLRGWDNGRGVDVGRAVKTAQADMATDHWHAGLAVGTGGTAPQTGSVVSGGITATTATIGSAVLPQILTSKVFGTSGNAFGTETRPRNVSVLYCIKAYDTPVSAGTLNIASLASDLSFKLSAADFTGANQNFGTGYQKLPGGLIVQWGITAVSATTGALVFPIAFPNAVSSVTVTAYHVTNAYANLEYISKTGVSNVFRSVACGYDWIAVGY